MYGITCHVYEKSLLFNIELYDIYNTFGYLRGVDGTTVILVEPCMSVSWSQ